VINNAVKHALAQAIAMQACSAAPTGSYVWTEQLTVLKVQAAMPLPTQDLLPLLVNLNAPNLNASKNLNSPVPIRDAMELNTVKSERKLNARADSKVFKCKIATLP